MVCNTKNLQANVCGLEANIQRATPTSFVPTAKLLSILSAFKSMAI